jgi:pimeloyl-ACP methyl ester carboxylesterase
MLGAGILATEISMDDEVRPADEAALQVFDVNRIRMRTCCRGDGPLVLLCHGFPESWYSWRHQIAALADAGYRVAAPDMRGYGGTDAPADPASYTMLHHVGDMVALVQALGEQQAVIIGHDWGAAVAWHAAMLRPDMFRAVAGLSVPFTSPARIDLLSALEAKGVHTFYMQYFQEPGVAEAELQADVEASIRRIYFSMSGDGPGRSVCGMLQPGAGLLDATEDPPSLPDWLPAEALAYAVGEFKRTGFRGGLNWYRNLRRNAELLAPWRGCGIAQPSLFIGGTRDDVLRFPGTTDRLEQLPRLLTDLRGSHVIEGAGHWIQQERAGEVNRQLLGFLQAL